MFVIWHKNDNEAFRAAYAALVGEEIQADPQVNGDFYLVGSGLITQEQADILQTNFAASSFSEDYPWGE